MPVAIKGSGGGSVTLDAGAAATDTTLTLPNTSGTLLQSGTAVTAAQGGTGLTSPGTAGNVLTSTGSAWASTAPASSGGFSNMQVFTATGTFTVPAGVTKVKVTVVGGGGAGGGYAQFAGTNYTASCGGAAGGAAIKIISGLTPGGSVAVTVGASVAGTTTTGTTGNNSSFGAYCSATGGAGGGISYIQTNCCGGVGLTPPPAGGIGSSGDINIKGGPGGAPSFILAVVNQFSASSGAGGNSILSGGAVPVSGFGAAGVASSGNGAGGSGATGSGVTSRLGGAGGAGIVIVEY